MAPLSRPPGQKVGGDQDAHQVSQPVCNGSLPTWRRQLVYFVSDCIQRREQDSAQQRWASGRFQHRVRTVTQDAPHQKSQDAKQKSMGSIGHKFVRKAHPAARTLLRSLQVGRQHCPVPSDEELPASDGEGEWP